MAEQIIARVIAAARPREASRAASASVSRKTATSNRLTLPGKLADCNSSKRNDSELFIVESDSAGGSVKQGRDRGILGPDPCYTDADSDGHHITTLLLTFFFRHMPDLIRAGRVYVAVPPLYRVDIAKETYWAATEGHRDRILAEHKKGNAKVDITRFKGLDEMPPKKPLANHPKPQNPPPPPRRHRRRPSHRPDHVRSNG